jgi:hypothetical protein
VGQQPSINSPALAAPAPASARLAPGRPHHPSPEAAGAGPPAAFVASPGGAPAASSAAGPPGWCPLLRSARSRPAPGGLCARAASGGSTRAATIWLRSRSVRTRPHLLRPGSRAASAPGTGAWASASASASATARRAIICRRHWARPNAVRPQLDREYRRPPRPPPPGWPALPTHLGPTAARIRR